MERIKRMTLQVVCDEQGGEVIEYALILGLIIVGTIAAIGAVGNHVMGRWNSISNSSF